MEFTGDLETHLSVRLGSPDRLAALQNFSQRHALKCLVIELDRGVSAVQPMLTRQSRGTLPHETTTALRLVAALQADGFHTTRVKIEAAPWNRDVPQSDTDARAHPARRYWEHHVKLLLPAGADQAALAVKVEPHGGHLSRNALKTRPDGQQERFVTQRCRGVGRMTAQTRLDGLLAAMTPFGYPVLEMEQEFVIYDSNLALDAGWITAESTL